jgi:3',5'-cyclic-nucleotide phosphodiesterase
VELYVVGCHGGETTKHRTCAFVLDEVLALDAGSVTSGLDLAAQARLEACVVSHAHLDHVRDLATLADNRCQMGLPPLVVAGTRATLAALRKHFFNGVLWPDFSLIPTPSEPTIVFQELEPERTADVVGYAVTPVLVNHSIESAGFVIGAKSGGSIAYSGDTGPTDRLFQVLDEVADLRALLMEVSFPERQRHVALASGHHTPGTLAADLRKLRTPRELPTLLYHIKPFFQAEVERECAAIEGHDLTILALEDHFVL